MAYTLPQVLVFQEFTQLPTAVVEPLRAHISGGNAQLFRFSEASEKSQISLGAYNPLADTDYLYPNRPTGGLVDQSYFKLWGDDVLLKYFEDLIGADSTIAPVSGKIDRVRSSTVNFKENVVGATTYARDSALLDRDVQVGDIVDLRATVLSTTYNLRTSVKGFVGDPVAATIGAASGDDNNEASQTADVTIAQSVGPYNCVEATADGSSYDGSVDGDISETYTITVTESSIGGDFTTAKLRVRSASGNDDADNVTPAAASSPTTIGTRGLTVTFSNSSDSSACSLSATEQGVSDDDLLAGQVWVVTVDQDFNAPTATSGGSYTLEYDTTYIVEVTRGGEFTNAAKPQITVTTVHGVDVSGPTNVTATATAVVVGTGGVTISFAGSGVDRLRKGDIYYIVVTAEKEGNMRTLVFNDNMPSGMEAATDIDLTLYISKDGVEIPENREGAAPLVNYDLGDPGTLDTGFTVKSGITLFDATWTDNGVEQALPVEEATLYAEYRAWVCDKGSQVFTIDDVADIDDIPGVLHPDNPLKWAVSKALANANGTEVKYTAVCDPDDTDEWQSVLDTITGRSDVYGLVPLTTNQTVLDLFVAHANSQSSATEGRWRVVWVQLVANATTAIVDASSSSNGAVVLATVDDDPDVAGNQFVIVEVPAGNAKFVTRGVRAGDLMRYNFTTDGWGEEAYDEFIIDAVINEDTLRLKTGQGTTQNLVAKKMEVYRSLTATELADQIATSAGTYGDKRVRAVWPDTVGAGGLSFAGFHMAAALAGLRSGVAPNQGLTNLEISGFDEVDRTVNLFNRTQLDNMAESGVWIVTQNDDGNIITRHALTTAGTGNVLTAEEMVIANVDSMSFVFLFRMEDMIGTHNVTPSVLELISLRIQGIISFLSEVRIERIGGQLIDAEVIDIRQHTLLKDRVVVELTLTVPVPLNNIELHLQIVA